MNYLILSVFIIGCELVGAISGLATAKAIPTWYQGLVKPSFNPPNWLFGPVWTLLYAMMGLAAWLIWSKGWQRADVRLALIIFGIQLALNFAWSFIFFANQNLGAALIEIIVMWLAIALTVVVFYKIDHRAAYLLLPYLAWVSFATLLNYSLWRLN